MKMKVFLAVSVCLVTLVAAYAADETGLNGKWATDAVGTAKPDTKSSSITGKILKSAGDVVSQQVPTGTGRGGPGGRARGGGVQIDTTAPVVLERGSSPDGAALILELKLDKAKLTGTVIEVVSGTKYDVEEAAVMGNVFQFLTYKKVSSVKVPTVYKGELVDEMTITLTRWSNAGKAIDAREDGSAVPLVFKRMK